MIFGLGGVLSAPAFIPLLQYYPSNSMASLPKFGLLFFFFFFFFFFFLLLNLVRAQRSTMAWKARRTALRYSVIPGRYSVIPESKTTTQHYARVAGLEPLHPPTVVVFITLT
eukprot:TRINITY_DN1308_c1_g1_i6.p1 TRINITY_DN1308_c1_g1~~TRINITY_DN1308_c1_g1_i6.p1  ORF type:complete len:112 (+),score=3.44 TRINITY_DN1308_c1_g1_i6:386-721(+)